METDSVGTAQLDYPDGSLTRLGPDSTLTIDELGSAEAQRTAVTLDVGQSWHRVAELVAEGSRYQVTTPVGVAAAKGTAFDVTCTSAPSCTITVIEGVVEFLTDTGVVVEINPYHRLVVPNPDGGDPVVGVAPADAIRADEWLSGNIAADDITQEIPVEAASIAGEWSGTRTFTEVSGVFGDTLGSVSEFSWTISEPKCDVDCTFTITSSGGLVYDAVVTETGFTIVTDLGSTRCKSELGPWDATVEVEAVRTDDASPPQSFSGTFTYAYERNGIAFSGCIAGPDTFTEVADLELTRS